MSTSILTKIYHRIYFILPMLFLSGCIGYTPTYYDDSVEFTVHIIDSNSSDNQNDIHVYIDDKETEFKKIKTFNKNYSSDGETLKIAYCSQEEMTIPNNCNFFYDIFFNVKRERQNKTIKITKHGKPDTIFNLYPQITNEKWASGKSEISSKESTTAAILLLPTNTYETVSICGQAVWGVLKGEPHTGGVAVSCLAFIPMAIGVDIYNVVIGLPSTAIINPWTNYKIKKNTNI